MSSAATAVRNDGGRTFTAGLIALIRTSEAALP